MDKYSDVEVQFIFDTVNNGPEAMPTHLCPTDRVREFLTKEWGILSYEEGDEDVEDEECFVEGYERDRYALEWVEGYVDVLGWTADELHALLGVAPADDDE